MSAPTARVRTLEAGPYRAEIDEVGAALVALRHEGRDLVLCERGTASSVPSPPFSGAVLAPWPNRIADGRYRFGGRTHQLPITETGRGNALHGLTLWQRWGSRQVSGASAHLEHTVHPQPGYPFTVRVSAQYSLDAQLGLTVTITAHNLGSEPAPVGLSLHPYLSVGDGRTVDEWQLELPCADVLETDERLLPRRRVAASTAGLDFRTARVCGGVELDHAFTGVEFDASARARAALVGPSGERVQVAWGRECGWLQVYTVHAPGSAAHRRAVAVEPMTCAPDAFNSGAGLVVLTPGTGTSMACTISA